MALLRRFIRRDLAELHQNNTKVRVIGSEEGVPADLLAMFRDAVALTTAIRVSSSSSPSIMGPGTRSFAPLSVWQSE